METIYELRQGEIEGFQLKTSDWSPNSKFLVSVSRSTFFPLSTLSLVVF